MVLSDPITRLAGEAQGRSRVVIVAPEALARGLVYTVATAESASSSLTEQTQLTLARLDGNLAEAGTTRHHMLSVTVYLTDITKKAEMDAVWNAWIGPGHWPQRACVQAALAGNDLIEIVVTAARPHAEDTR